MVSTPKGIGQLIYIKAHCAACGSLFNVCRYLLCRCRCRFSGQTEPTAVFIFVRFPVVFTILFAAAYAHASDKDLLNKTGTEGKTAFYATGMINQER
ncbi:MAG TPA: hypothetical protein VLS44_09715 [Nitrospira sp.]|nr:hypothetical protein [Nitrospira sp.]